MNWTTTTPEVAGFYWMRRTQNGSTKYSAKLVEITGHAPFFSITVLGPTLGRATPTVTTPWAPNTNGPGPIPEPEDA